MKNKMLYCLKCYAPLEVKEDKKFYCNYCHSFFTFEDMKIQIIIKSIFFTNLNLPLSVIDDIFEEKRYTEIDKLKLFSKIVDEIDLSKNFNELIRLVSYFSKKYDYSGFKRPYSQRHRLFDNSYDGDNQMAGFMYLFNAVIEARNDVRRIPTRTCPKCMALVTSWSSTCPSYKCNYQFRNLPKKIENPTSLIMKKLPDLLKVFESFNFRLNQYVVFGSMIQKIDTNIITKHRVLIENVLLKLLNNWYRLPEDLGEMYLTKEGLYSELVRGIEATDLLEHKAPYFSKLVEVLPWDEPMYMALSKLNLISLIGLIERRTLTENQWSNLIWMFENLIDNLDIIQVDKDFIQLFNAASSFVNILLQKNPDLVKQTFTNKISLFTANLEAIKKNFTTIGNEFDKFFSISKLHNVLYSGEISKVIKLLNTKGFEDFIKQFYSIPAKNLDPIQNILNAIDDSGFLNSINIWTIEEELNQDELKLLREFMLLVKNWKNKDYNTPDIDFLDEIRKNQLRWKGTKPFNYSRDLTETVILTGVCEGETEKVLLIEFKDGRSHWLPKSTIHSTYDPKLTTPQEFEIDSWIAVKMNLI